MTDKMLDASQVVNGIAVLLSFFAGYKYAIKKHVPELDDTKPKKTEEEDPATPTRTFSDFGGDYKMVLVVRNDLKMGKGKIAAQCGHAAVGAFQNAMKRAPQMIRRWENSGSAKIALKVESEPEMMALLKAANSQGLVTCLIRDAGRTQIAPNSKTVLAVGPGPVSAIDKITGHLKLL